MSRKAEKKILTDEFTICPSCSYSGGFHVIFKRIPDEIKMNLACPSCHDEFDLNFTIAASDKDNGA